MNVDSLLESYRVQAATIEVCQRQIEKCSKQRNAVVALLAAEMSRAELAKKLGISSGRISQMIKANADA